MTPNIVPAIWRYLTAFWVLGLLQSSSGAVPLAAAASPNAGGRFWRLHWYERGLENANPKYDKRFRVNAAETSLHPEFGRRIEARENGLMLINVEEDLFQITQAELYLELWGGHPGTARKRVNINGRSMFLLPDPGTEKKNCAYTYPAVPLKITDLVNGWNAIQFACDIGSTFWGHFLVDNACLRVALAPDHPDLKAAGLAGFTAAIEATRSGPEQLTLSMAMPAGYASLVSAVEFQGRYLGYDENGDGQNRDWHGFTKARQPVAWLGLATAPPFRVTWDTTMLPAQRDVCVRALVRFTGPTNVVFLTEPKCGVEIPERAGAEVTLHLAKDLPRPYWSRAGRTNQCTIGLPFGPAQIERAELHVVTWSGGAGTVKTYFTLNGRHFPVAEGSAHETVYSRLPVDPRLLRRGANRIELLSDTQHHGIEIFLPGPALMVRTRKP